jgi:hypothetical protein
LTVKTPTPIRGSYSVEKNGGASWLSICNSLRVRIATAAHAAAPSLPVMPATEPPADGMSRSGAQFASQLNAAALLSADAGAWRPAATSAADFSAAQALLSLPKISARPIVTSLPARASSKQAPSPKTPKAQSQPADSTLAAPTAVLPEPVPAPEMVAAAAAATEADTAIDAESAAATPKPTVEEPAEPSAPTVSAAAEPAHQTQDMAFAARVQAVENTSHAALPSEMASNAAVASASKKVVAAADDESATPADARVPLTAVSANMERTASPTPASAPAPVAASHPTEAVAPAETTPKATAPLKDIALQVNQPGKERVDVRVVQQGNEVHVSVHSGDAILNSGLRQGLSDLQSRLEENGYRSEMWRPGVATAPVAAAPSAQASSNFSRGGDSQAQQQQSGSQQDSGRRNQNQSGQPRWVEEMESSLQGGQQSSGGFYGFGS